MFLRVYPDRSLACQTGGGRLVIRDGGRKDAIAVTRAIVRAIPARASRCPAALCSAMRRPVVRAAAHVARETRPKETRQTSPNAAGEGIRAKGRHAPCSKHSSPGEQCQSSRRAFIDVAAPNQTRGGGGSRRRNCCRTAETERRRPVLPRDKLTQLFR